MRRIAPLIQLWNEHEAVELSRRFDRFWLAFANESKLCQRKLEVLEKSVKVVSEGVQIIQEALESARRDSVPEKQKMFGKAAAKMVAVGQTVGFHEKSKTYCIRFQYKCQKNSISSTLQKLVFAQQLRLCLRYPHLPQLARTCQDLPLPAAIVVHVVVHLMIALFCRSVDASCLFCCGDNNSHQRCERLIEAKTKRSVVTEAGFGGQLCGCIFLRFIDNIRLAQNDYGFKA